MKSFWQLENERTREKRNRITRGGNGGATDVYHLLMALHHAFLTVSPICSEDCSYFTFSVMFEIWLPEINMLTRTKVRPSSRLTYTRNHMYIGSM